MFVVAAPVLFADAITLHKFEGKSHDVLWGESGDEDLTTFLTFYKMGKLIATIKDDKLPSLDKLHEVAVQYDSSMDPFYGPGFSFLAKDSKGQVYSIDLEYVKGNKTFNGNRCRICRLQSIGHIKGIYINPASVDVSSGGSSFNKRFLAHLVKVVKKQAEQDVAPNP